MSDSVGGGSGTLIAVVLVAAAGIAVVALWPRAPSSPAPAATVAASASARGAVALTPPPAPAVPSHVPRNLRASNPKVLARVVGEGFEVVNTDPALTGTTVEITGTDAQGQPVSFRVPVPPPAPSSSFAR